MKATIEIPDPLLHRAEAAAASEGKTLTRFVSEAIENRLKQSAPPTAVKNRISPPLVRSKAPGSLKIDGDVVARAMIIEDLDAVAGH